MTLLRVEAMSAGYQGVPVVRDLDLTVGEGEVVALLGPNGAGKTTTLCAISGLVEILAGDIEVFGRSVRKRQAHRIARDGLAHVPEGRGLFFRLSVGEHLRLAPGDRGANVERALSFFPALEPLMDRRAGLLSGGQQQILALAQALTRGPRLLVVDELSLAWRPT